MDLVPNDPFTVLVSNFGHRAVHLPKHTIVGLALPSPTHILTLGMSAPGGAEAKEGGGDRVTRDGIINSSTPSTALDEQDHARREEPDTDEPEDARRKGPVTDDAHAGYSRDADTRTDTEGTGDTDVEEPRS